MGRFLFVVSITHQIIQLHKEIVMTFISDRLAQNEQLLDQQKQSERQKNMRKSSSRFLFEPTQIMQTLRAQIVGQDEALDEIQKMLSVVKADFCAKDKPLSVSAFTKNPIPFVALI